MGDFSYETLVIRFSYAFAFVAFIVVLLYAYVLEVKRDEVAQNLAFQQSVLADLGNGGADSLPLNKVHRTHKELQGWVNRVISEALSFDTSMYVENKKTVEIYFNRAGFAQYESYLESSGILKSLADNNYRMSLFAEDKPLLLNGSEVNGIYRWLYQMPVTISFLPRNLSDLRNTKEQAKNKKIMLRLQVRRVPAADNIDEMQVESWTVTGRR